jgi:hypothetical protein
MVGTAKNPKICFSIRRKMKARTFALTMALCVFAGAVCLASDVQIGTWKLNEAKSKLAPGTSKNSTVVYQAMGDEVKVTVEGTNSSGQPTHNEWTGKFDGKFYPVTGDPNTDERAYKQINGRTMDLTTKKGGKVTATGRIVVAADGKSRTVTIKSADSMGMTSISTAVYDKQ